MKPDALVTDTHPLVFYAAGLTRKLSAKARLAFQRVERGTLTLYVPAPVSLELWLLARGGRISVTSTLAAWWRNLGALPIVQEPMRHEDVLAAIGLAWDHRDVFDRTIVAVAARLALPLITADTAIAESDLVDVYW